MVCYRSLVPHSLVRVNTIFEPQKNEKIVNLSEDLTHLPPLSEGKCLASVSASINLNGIGPKGSIAVKQLHFRKAFKDKTKLDEESEKERQRGLPSISPTLVRLCMPTQAS